MRGYVLLIALLFSALGASVSAQDVHQELQETVRAEVVRVLSESTRDIVGTDTQEVVQDVQVRIMEGERRGEVATFENDLMHVVVGDSLYVNRLVSIDGVEYYQFKDADRRMPLLVLVGLFVVVLVGFAGFHGFRALLSLGLSVVAILLVLVPLLLKGYPPVLTSVGVAGGVLALALFLTHGIRRTTTIAFLGTFGAIVLTSLLAWFFAHFAHLTGLSSDEAIFLNFSTKGTLDFGALLLASIIIGILGILDDVAMTQVAVVEELMHANSRLGFFELYTRAIRVGRAHITSLVNTLSFAYVGAALPLILLMAAAGSSIGLSLNQEIVAAELIRIFVGSIGLIMAVPLTTLIAVYWYQKHGVGDAAPSREGQCHTH
jgi:uncharacterized membrane protein